MLRKLLKYEFMSTARVFGLCYIGVLVAALLMRIFGDIAYTQNLQNGTGIFNVTEILTMTSTGFYFLMIAAVCVLTFVPVSYTHLLRSAAAQRLHVSGLQSIQCAAGDNDKFPRLAIHAGNCSG